MERKSILLTEHPFLFGLSRTEPAQGITTLSAEAVTKADVDIYLDEIEGLNVRVVAASNDGDLDTFSLMSNARRNAIRTLEADLLAGLSSLYGTVKRRYEGSVGGLGQSQGLVDTYDGQLVTFSMRPKEAPGAVALIKKVGLLIDRSTSVEVLVTGSDTPVLVVATADTPSFTVLAKPILVRLDQIEHLTASYAASGFQPRHNLTSCGCSAMDTVLADYFENVYNQPANGVLLDMEISCDESQVLTANYDASLAMQDTLAYAARFKAAELLIEGIISTTNLNRYVMLDREHLWGKRNHYRKEYTDRLTWLVGADGIDTSYSACYPCRASRNDPGFQFGTILI
jgi:hypothetical protein